LFRLLNEIDGKFSFFGECGVQTNRLLQPLYPTPSSPVADISRSGSGNENQSSCSYSKITTQNGVVEKSGHLNEKK
jgi:hypothetical protein